MGEFCDTRGCLLETRFQGGVPLTRDQLASFELVMTCLQCPALGFRTLGSLERVRLCHGSLRKPGLESGGSGSRVSQQALDMRVLVATADKGALSVD